MTTPIVLALLVILGCSLAALQIFVRRRIRYNATHFLTSGSDASLLPGVDRWTVAVIAPYLMPLALPVDTFRPPEFRRVPLLTSILSRDWSIKDRAELLRVMEHLRTTGHRAYCASISSRPGEVFLAWDLMRLVLLAWAGLNLEWLSRAEFLDIVTSAGRDLQATFADWESAAASYEAGLAIWAVQSKVRRLAERAHVTIDALLQDPQSPWQQTAWRTPLTATIAE